MKLDDFIDNYGHDTDCYVTHWDSDGEGFVICTLDACPWWMEEKEREGKRGIIKLTLSNIVESELVLGWRAREVEDLAVDKNGPLLWSRGEQAQFYGSAPLPKPEQFFVKVVDINKRYGINRDTIWYFGGVTFQDWKLRVINSDSYLIAEVPLPIADDVEAALKDISAEYSRIEAGSNDSIENLQVVWVGESWFICESADVDLSTSSDKPLQTDAAKPRD